jgi:hypothetical protein
MPIAINEGLAEYFGEALFTGDAFVAGVVPPWRLKRVRASLEEKKFVPLPELLALSHKEWNARLGTTNYDHAWTLVHFLVEGGRQVALENFIRDTAAGASWQAACEKHLGRVEDIESAWRSYWTKLPDDAAGELYAQATMRTLTSFLARATLRRQRFDSFEGFVSAAKQGELKSAESDWLPPSLLNDALARVAAMQKDGGLFALSSRAPRPPHLLYEDKDGRQMAGKFTLKGSRVERYEVGFVAHSLGSGRRPATKASP